MTAVIYSVCLTIGNRWPSGDRSQWGKVSAACYGTGTSKLLTLPQTGAEDNDHNPDRVKPRHIFSLGFGADNLMHAERPRRIKASLEISNLTNVSALYNFLSTFSGTHFLVPRRLVASVDFAF